MQRQDRPSIETKSVYLPGTSKVTLDIVKHLDQVFEFASPAEYRETLSEIYHMYNATQHPELPISFDEMTAHVCILLEFLKHAEIEIKNTSSKW